jgi:hypothetical protein
MGRRPLIAAVLLAAISNGLNLIGANPSSTMSFAESFC